MAIFQRASGLPSIQWQDNFNFSNRQCNGNFLPGFRPSIKTMAKQFPCSVPIAYRTYRLSHVLAPVVKVKIRHTAFSQHAAWSGNDGHFDGYGYDGYGYDGYDGKTVFTEVSTNPGPIGLNFGTQPFLSMLPGLAMADTLMAMAMMPMAMMATMAKLFLQKVPPIMEIQIRIQLQEIQFYELLQIHFTSCYKSVYNCKKSSSTSCYKFVYSCKKSVLRAATNRFYKLLQIRIQLQEIQFYELLQIHSASCSRDQLHVFVRLFFTNGQTRGATATATATAVDNIPIILIILHTTAMEWHFFGGPTAHRQYNGNTISIFSTDGNVMAIFWRAFGPPSRQRQYNDMPKIGQY